MIEQEFKKYYEAEIENLNKVLNEIKKIREFRPKELDNIKIAASGTFLHNFYNGIENVLKRALLDIILCMDIVLNSFHLR